MDTSKQLIDKTKTYHFCLMSLFLPPPPPPIKFCCSNHKLSIEADRQQSLSREDRKCTKCNSYCWRLIFLLITVLNLFLENFFNHHHGIIFVNVCLPQRKQIFQLCQTLYGEQTFSKTTDYGLRSLLLNEHFACVKHN